MNGLTWGSLIVIVLSAASLYWEFSGGSTTATVLPEPVYSEQGSSIAAVIAVDDRDFTALLSKPVFAENRKPLKPATGSAGGETDAEVVYELSGQYRLAGIVLTPEQELAIIIDQKSGKAHKLAVSESIAGWQLKQLEPVMAVFEKAQQQRRLALKQSPQQSTAGTAQQNWTAPDVIDVGAQVGIFDEDPYQ
jgi:hypothetical protein